MPIVNIGGLVPPTVEAEVSTSVELTPEQQQLAAEAKAAFIGTGLMTAEWIRRMRDLRDSLVPTGGNGNGCKEHPFKANNWKQVCADLFQGLDSMHANGMIRGYESLWGGSGARPSGPGTNIAPDAAEIQADPALRTLTASPTFYRELGKVKADVRPALVEKLRKGEMSATSMAVQKTAKKVEREQALAGVQSVKALAPKAAPKPVAPKTLPMSGEEKTYSLAKWRQVPEQTEELEWVQKHLEKMRKAAVAYRNSCKQLEARMAQGIADNRNHPALMTVYATIWKESDFDFDATLQEITAELAEANRLWGLAMPLCHGSAKITE